MDTERKIKAAKAKMYNLRSGIDGLIALLDAETLAPETAIDSCATLAAKAVKEWSEMPGNSDSTE